MQKPRYSPEDEQTLMAQLWSPSIKDDPEAFVLFVFPWGCLLYTSTLPTKRIV